MLSLAVMACLGWAYYFERSYLYYVNSPFPTSTPVHAGEPVELIVERCSRSRTRRAYMTTHSLRNVATGAIELLPDVWVDIEPGCTRSTSRINLIPKGTAPGTYTVSGTARVEGLVMTHRVPWTSRPFQVLPALPAKEK